MINLKALPSHHCTLSSRSHGVRDTRADDLCTDGEKMTHTYKIWPTIAAYLADYPTSARFWERMQSGHIRRTGHCLRARVMMDHGGEITYVRECC